MNKLFVKGLPFTITREAIETIFQEVNHIFNIYVASYNYSQPLDGSYACLRTLKELSFSIG